MTRFLCITCGTQYADRATPPEHCAICEDDRQYVGHDGQRWTTHAEVVENHTLRMEQHAGLLALGVTPSFAIDRRSFLLPTDAGNLLWEAQCMVNDEAVARLREHGGVDKIVISHPHFYSAMVEWSEALDDAPILLHEADTEWIQFPHRSIETWSGDTLALSESVTLIRCGGHFTGSTALHWSEAPRGGGALFSGDALQVAADRRHVSFMYSYPNMVPMRTSNVQRMRDRLAPYEFEDVFGYTWGSDIRGGARAAVDASYERYLAAVLG
ncbi:MAG: hypothetical protein DHS20C15_32880 [Planctomycetota bacterium]|nr:MAG: hypothetical protein DHS20C15_32880 [Planctomycetota bacterium]